MHYFSGDDHEMTYTSLTKISSSRYLLDVKCIANGASTQWYGGLPKWCELLVGRPFSFELDFWTMRLIYAGTECARSRS